MMDRSLSWDELQAAADSPESGEAVKDAACSLGWIFSNRGLIPYHLNDRAGSFLFDRLAMLEPKRGIVGWA